MQLLLTLSLTQFIIIVIIIISSSGSITMYLIVYEILWISVADMNDELCLLTSSYDGCLCCFFRWYIMGSWPCLRQTGVSNCRTSVRQVFQNVPETKNLLSIIQQGNFGKTWPIEPIRYFTWIILIQIAFKNQWTPFSNTVYWLVLVLTIAIRANIVVPPDDNIHSYYRTMVTRNYCSPGLIDSAPGLK